MKKGFTFVLTVLALVACVFTPMGMMGQVVSGTTYNTTSTSSMPTGWSSNGTNAGGSSAGYYILLGTSDSYIKTSNFTQNGFSKVVVKARKYNGPSTAQAKIYVSWYDATTSAETVLGTLDPTSTTLSNYTISSPTNPTGNTTGYIKIQCKGASNSTGSGISQVTITYTTGTTIAYTVTLSDTGETLNEASAGAGVTLPTRSAVGEYTFYGWSTSSCGSTESTTAPTNHYTGTYHPTSNITVYPVYKRIEGEDVTQWQLVSNNEVTAGTYALLTNNNKAFNGTISGGHGQVTSSAFSFVNNVATSAPDGTCEIIVEVVTNGYKFRNSSQGYLTTNGSTSGSLTWASSDSKYWTITSSNLYYTYSSSNTKVYLRYFNGSSGYSLRTYGSASGGSGAVKFAKKIIVSTSTTYYITEVNQPALEPSCEITPNTHEFGNVAIGSSNTVTFTVNTENLAGDLTVSIDYMADGFSVSPTSIASTATTTTLTVTFAPAAATADLTATLTISGGGLEDDVEALVSGMAVQANTVTFNCNGGMATAPAQQSVLSGASVTLPNAGNLNSDFTFVGWTIDPNYVDDEYIFHVGESVTVAGDETYYAVYSHSVFQPTGEKYYEKVTENLSDWTGTYLMVYEFYVDWDNGNLYVFDSPYDASAYGKNTYALYEDIFDYYSNHTIEYNETTAAYEIAVAKTTNGYSLFDKGSSAYLGYNNTGGNNGAYLRWDETFTSSQNEWSLSPNDVVSVYNNAKVIRWNETSPRFAIYASDGNQEPVQLYKYVEAGTTTTARYTRVFLNETATDDIEIDGPSIIPSDYSLDMGENSLDNATAANLVIEEGGQLIHSNNGVQATLQKDITAYTSQKDNYYLMALPFDSYSVEGSPLVTVNGNYDLYTFDGSQTQEEWQQVGTDGAFDPTVGFLYANNEGGTLNLTGTLVPSNEPYDASLEYDATKTYGAWNLVGNPFACNATISVSDFYVIEGEELSATTGVIAPLQGVMVQATEPSQHIVFTKAAGAKSAQAIKVNVYKENASKGAAVVDRAIVRFDESQGLVKFQLNPNHTKVYFTKGNKDYAVVRSANEGEMPVSFKAEKSGSYTINVEAENVEMTYLHLIDNITGADVDLLQTPSYTFEASSSDYENRFRLVFNATGIEENDIEANTTFAYFNGSEWVINNPSTGSGDNATLQVVDMMGRVLSSQTLNGNANVTLNQPAGIYMLRLVNGENVMVQKVVVR